MTAKSKLKLGMATILGVAILSACSDASAPQSQTDASPKQRVGNLVVEAAHVPAAPPVRLAPAALTETDHMMLEQAASACKNGDFKPFLEAALRSKPVRLRYFTKPVNTPTGARPVESYSFPFQIMDYNYVTVESVEKTPDAWEYVQLDINQAQDERVSVDWVRIDFGKNGNDEGETPEDDKTYGPRGQLLFYPTNECWTLLEDGTAG